MIKSAVCDLYIIWRIFNSSKSSPLLPEIARVCYSAGTHVGAVLLPLFCFTFVMNLLLQLFCQNRVRSTLLKIIM